MKEYTGRGATVSVQAKLAELESRIAAIEKHYPATRTPATPTRVDLEPEMGLVWKSFDALFDKLAKLR